MASSAPRPISCWLFCLTTFCATPGLGEKGDIDHRCPSWRGIFERNPVRTFIGFSTLEGYQDQISQMITCTVPPYHLHKCFKQLLDTWLGKGAFLYLLFLSQALHDMCLWRSTSLPTGLDGLSSLACESTWALLYCFRPGRRLHSTVEWHISERMVSWFCSRCW